MRSSRSIRRIIIGLSCWAGIALPAAASAGAEAGKDQVLACAACHVSSDPAADAPWLSGQRETYLARQLAAFKRGDRANPLMSAIARQLSDTDVTTLAAYWSGQPAARDVTEPDATAVVRKSHMVFPKDFPRGFVLYLTTNNSEKRIVSRLYINTLGLRAARANQPLPDGSVIIEANYAVKLGADQRPVVETDGSWAVTRLGWYNAREARAGWGSDIPALLRNGNWNYSVFLPDGTPRSQINQAQCFACHKPQAAVSYLFSYKELQDSATAK